MNWENLNLTVNKACQKKIFLRSYRERMQQPRETWYDPKKFKKLA